MRWRVSCRGFRTRGETSMKALSGSELRTRLMVGLALLTSCVPGAGESTQPEPVPPPEPNPGPPPNFGPPKNSSLPAKPIIGGTLIVLPDARTAVAADPDRERIFVADYRQRKVLA